MGERRVSSLLIHAFPSTTRGGLRCPMQLHSADFKYFTVTIPVFLSLILFFPFRVPSTRLCRKRRWKVVVEVLIVEGILRSMQKARGKIKSYARKKNENHWGDDGLNEEVLWKRDGKKIIYRWIQRSFYKRLYIATPLNDLIRRMRLRFRSLLF